jgi:gliding motility-associated-like protein
MTVVVSSGFTPTFNPISAVCEGESFSLPVTSNEGVTGIWSPANNNLQTTNYTFTPNPGQCTNTTNLTVVVNPIPQISINENPTICQGESTTLSTSIDINGGNYLWSPDAQITSSILINPASTTTYSVTYEVNGCQSQPASATATVNPSTAPTFDSFGPFCEDAILVQVILPETSNNGITGTWNPVMLSTDNPGLNSYQFTPDPGQCASVYNMTVEVFSTPLIDAGNNVTICTGSSVQLIASGGTQYSWTNGIQNGQSFLPIQTQVYYVTGTDANGCEAADSVIVTLAPVPNAQFSSDANLGTAPLSVNFTNTSSNATSFDWNFGDGNEISTIDLSNVSNLFLNPGSYTVWLVASNGLCSDSISDIIIVNAPGESILTVPNVLTPNGDGTNDEWFIYTENVAELEVIIVNRWGNEVAIIDGVAGSWNGKTTNGDDATDGTYFYKYTAKALNGENLSGHGFLTLIR